MSRKTDIVPAVFTTGLFTVLLLLLVKNLDATFGPSLTSFQNLNVGEILSNTELLSSGSGSRYFGALTRYAQDEIAAKARYKQAKIDAFARYNQAKLAAKLRLLRALTSISRPVGISRPAVQIPRRPVVISRPAVQIPRPVQQQIRRPVGISRPEQPPAREIFRPRQQPQLIRPRPQQPRAEEWSRQTPASFRPRRPTEFRPEPRVRLPDRQGRPLTELPGREMPQLRPEIEPQTRTQPDLVTEAVTESIAETFTESTAEPVTEAISETFTESPAEPVTEATAAEEFTDALTETTTTEPVTEEVTDALFTQAPRIAEERTDTGRFALADCYETSTGYTCCNEKLEDLMRRIMVGERHSQCNVHQTAKKLQFKAESLFNKRFEVIAALGDFAYTTNFFGNLTCKIKLENQYVLAYGIPDDTSRIFSEDLPPSQFSQAEDSLDQACVNGENGCPSAAPATIEVDDDGNFESTTVFDSESFFRRFAGGNLTINSYIGF